MKGIPIKLIDRGVRANLPAEQQKEYEKLLAEGLGHFRAESLKRIGLYGDDFLCPGFKRKLDETTRERVLRAFADAGKYPKYEEPGEMMVRKGEAFARDYRKHIENAIGLFLFDVFMQTLGLDLNKTEYWGQMRFRAQSVNERILGRPALWPGVIRLLPDGALNERNKWERNKRR